MSFQPSVRPGSIRPYGLIGERWQERGGDHGVFRHAITEEYDVPGFRGRRQSFANGQIAWSPDQGHRMLVSVHYDVTGRPRTSGWFHVPMPPSTSAGVGVTSPRPARMPPAGDRGDHLLGRAALDRLRAGLA